MQSESREPLLNTNLKAILVFLLTVVFISLVLFRNLLFQSTYLLKSFGELSIDPEIAFKNNKPTFLEFYAEWCEVCREMAPKVDDIKKEYEKDINFVFLNVDNPKWEKYIRKFNVNGIPQVNLFDEEANLEVTFIGKQQEKTIKESLENLNNGFKTNSQVLNSEFSIIKQSKNYQTSPRSHG